MDKIPDSIKKIINKFLKEVKRQNLTIDEVFLFGSYAKGNNHKYSDIDIAIISKDFVGNNFLDSKRFDDAIFNSSIDIEVHTFSPDDFLKQSPLVMEILTTGYKIQ